MADDTSNFYDNLMGNEDGNIDAALAPDKSPEDALMDAGNKDADLANLGQPTDSPPVKTSEPIDEGAKKEDTPASEDTKKTEETPLPYDKDPKWKAARAAEKRLGDILEKHGFESSEDMEAALASGIDIQTILGDKDAGKVLADSEHLAKLVAQDKADKLRKLEEEESESETIARLRRTNEDLLNAANQRDANQQRLLDDDQALSTFNDRVATTIEAEEGLSSSEKTLLEQFLGVDNPINDVNIEDMSAVTKVAKTGIGNFKDLVKTIKQSAIDEYAAGKSEITPISKTETGSETKTVKKTSRQPANIDEAMDDAKGELMEIFSNIDLDEMVG